MALRQSSTRIGALEARGYPRIAHRKRTSLRLDIRRGGDCGNCGDATHLRIWSRRPARVLPPPPPTAPIPPPAAPRALPRPPRFDLRQRRAQHFRHAPTATAESRARRARAPPRSADHNPASRFSRSRWSFSVSGSTASTFDSATISGFFGEAVAIGREFRADGPIGVAGVFAGRVDEMEQRAATLDMAEEAIAEAVALVRASIRPGMSASTKSRSSTAPRQGRDAAS